MLSGSRHPGRASRWTAMAVRNDNPMPYAPGLTHLPRNDIPSGILSSNVTFLRATYFVPAVCDDRANQFFEKPCIRPMRPENARIRLPAGLASPELGCTGSCRDRAGLETIDHSS